MLLDEKCVDLVCITETHFSEEIVGAEINLTRFTAFRGDRNFKLDRTRCKADEFSGGGGSVIYVRNYIKVVDKSHCTTLDSTSLVLETDIGKVLIGCFYRSPSLNEEQNSKFLETFSQKAVSDDDIEKVMFGDFNCPDISWVSGNVDGPKNSVNNNIVLQQKFVDNVHNAGLSWLVTDEITRHRKVGIKVQESNIDQVFLSEESLVNEFNLYSPLGKSDHVSMIVELGLVKINQCHSTEIDDAKRNWSKVTLNDILLFSNNIDWGYSKEPMCMNIEDMWDEIHSKIRKVIDLVPINSNSNPENSNYNMPWLNSSLKRAVRAKNKSWELFDACPSIDNLNYALSKQGELDNIELRAKLKYEKLITSDLKHNSKAFYSYLRTRRKVKSIVTVLKKADGSMTENDTETADCFADAFSSVFVNEPIGPLPQHCYKSSDETISEVEISEGDVYQELKSVNIYKSSGPDNIHPKVLNALADNPDFTKSLTSLYVKCAQEQKIPHIWKVANVVGLHKKDSKTDPLNYRPVSLTCILCKIYEKFIRVCWRQNY